MSENPISLSELIGNNPYLSIEIGMWRNIINSRQESNNPFIEITDQAKPRSLNSYKCFLDTIDQQVYQIEEKIDSQGHNVIIAQCSQKFIDTFFPNGINPNQPQP